VAQPANPFQARPGRASTGGPGVVPRGVQQRGRPTTPRAKSGRPPGVTPGLSGPPPLPRRGPTPGCHAQADPCENPAVRLTRITQPWTQPLTGQRYRINRLTSASCSPSNRASCSRLASQSLGNRNSGGATGRVDPDPSSLAQDHPAAPPLARPAASHLPLSAHPARPFQKRLSKQLCTSDQYLVSCKRATARARPTWRGGCHFHQAGCLPLWCLSMKLFVCLSRQVQSCPAAATAAPAVTGFSPLRHTFPRLP
jgi:hypothetical protein